jgi:prepilin-type N-terminal cleavage/methylation domain-containing protein
MNIIKIDNKGFSLIEALVALVVLAIGLLAVGLMQIGAMKANTNALGRTDGVAVAQSQLDRLRSLPLDDPDLQDGGGTNDGIAGLDDGEDGSGTNPDIPKVTIVGPNGRDYEVFWNVVDDTPVDGVKTVRVFTYWRDPKLGLNRVVFTSILGGLYL